ncbi:glutaredoxin domain-containing protein [Rhodococcus jostii]|uniref:glutaredoxin domain-containing protein n=1 Tax=Rhodococcus jostii TaxID=132919 RepID=UPI003641BF36
MNVTVYSKPNCVGCTATKRLLTRLEIPHTVVDITEDRAAYEYVRSLGYSAAPVVVAELSAGTQHWAEFREERIRHLRRELDAIAYLNQELS